MTAVNITPVKFIAGNMRVAYIVSASITAVYCKAVNIHSIATQSRRASSQAVNIRSVTMTQVNPA